MGGRPGPPLSTPVTTHDFSAVNSTNSQRVTVVCTVYVWCCTLAIQNVSVERNLQIGLSVVKQRITVISLSVNGHDDRLKAVITQLRNTSSIRLKDV